MDHAQSRILPRGELEGLLERHLDVLRYYVRLRAGPLLRTREPISDLVQSALREAIEQRESFQFTHEGAFRRWLYTLATHKIISKNRYHVAARRDAARGETLASAMWELPQEGAGSTSGSPSGVAEHSEELERLQRAFDELDEEERQVVSMRKIFDIPAADIAAQLGIAESTVRWRLTQAMTRLAGKLC